jgi:hypothetical protein
MRQLRRRDRLVCNPLEVGRDLMGRSDTITPFPHPERGGAMRRCGDNPYLSAGAIGVGEGGRVGRAKSHVSSPLQSSGADAARCSCIQAQDSTRKLRIQVLCRRLTGTTRARSRHPGTESTKWRLQAIEGLALLCIRKSMMRGPGSYNTRMRGVYQARRDC